MPMTKAKRESLYDDAGDTTWGVIKDFLERHPSISYDDALVCVDAALDAFADELDEAFAEAGAEQATT